MFRTLKGKILSGYILIAAMLVAYTGFAVYNLLYLRESFSTALQENYRSIEYSTQMIESSERMDSDILSSFSGHIEAESSFLDHLANLNSSLARADSNITLEGEAFLLESIRSEVGQYSITAERFFSGDESGSRLQMYTQEILPIFQGLKNDLYKLLAMNQMNMYNMANENNQKAAGLIYAGVITAVTALVFSLFIGWWTGFSLSRPIYRIISLIEGDKKIAEEERGVSEFSGIAEIDHLFQKIISLLKEKGK